ncbi:metallophosphoesterase [Pedobacter foliorum]|uniref:metallophosphoesterase n=1 Tax=Pedobacter foliorum TaxID=2739058 RepID=UPI001565F5C4|nr:metallophosphoesterase [Pedobacter foliorum]NRF40665.1 metallophosphoesterase [Pedobacter foliorum]
MKVTRRKFIRTGLLVTLGAVLVDMFWFEKFFIETNEFYIGKATKETTNIKVVQISDLHLQSINSQLSRLASKLNKLKPELILITGDAIDKAQNVSLLNDFLKLIDKQIKKVAILGNWEYWGNIDLNELNKVYLENNCTLLVNQTTQYLFGDTSISITGVDDFVGGNANYNAAIKDYKKSDYHIVLNHCPQYNDYISTQIDTHVDFILSGHTHGGQINLLGFAPFLPPGSGKYVKGWYTQNNSKFYVSKGIGTSMLPARFGARAEIAIFNLS